MRVTIIASALVLAVPAQAAPIQAGPIQAAAPVVAAPQAAPRHAMPPHAAPGDVAPDYRAPHHAVPPVVVLPPVLSDPALADRVGQVAGVLTKSLMDLPVGEVEAALEGRLPTRADRRRTVRDSIPDPYLDRRVAEQAAASGRTVQAATKALAASLPAILQAVEGARGEIERAISNLPDPTYPRR